jgi:hypothetical protein
MNSKFISDDEIFGQKQTNYLKIFGKIEFEDEIWTWISNSITCFSKSENNFMTEKHCPNFMTDWEKNFMTEKILDCNQVRWQILRKTSKIWHRFLDFCAVILFQN